MRAHRSAIACAALALAIASESPAQAGAGQFMQDSEDELAKAVTNALNTGQIDAAARILLKAAHGGSAYAQVMWGSLKTEYGGEDSAALYWFRKAADQRYPTAYYRIGQMYLGGRGLPKDERRGYDWILRAAILGEASAQSVLAGREAARLSFGPALFWGTRSADQGDELGAKVLWTLREGMTKYCDEAKAVGSADLISERCFTWIKSDLAAPPPVAADCVSPVRFDLQGPRDATRSWFRLWRGVEAGVTQCAYVLGLLSYVSDKHDDAHRILVHAAINGHVEAQAILGPIYEEGKGIPQDSARAAFWRGTAAQGGNESALTKAKERGIPYWTQDYGVTAANLSRLGYTAEGMDELEPVPGGVSPSWKPPATERVSSKHTSKLFSVVLPAGWDDEAVVNPEPLLKEMRWGFYDGGIRSEEIFTREDQSGRATLVMGVWVMPHDGVDGGFDHNLKKLIANLASEKRTVGSKRMLIGRGSVEGANPAGRFLAAIPLGKVMLYVWCTLPEADADELWPEFLSIVESVEANSDP